MTDERVEAIRQALDYLVGDPTQRTVYEWAIADLDSLADENADLRLTLRTACAKIRGGHDAEWAAAVLLWLDGASEAEAIAKVIADRQALAASDPGDGQ